MVCTVIAQSCQITFRTNRCKYSGPGLASKLDRCLADGPGSTLNEDGFVFYWTRHMDSSMRGNNWNP